VPIQAKNTDLVHRTTGTKLADTETHIDDFRTGDALTIDGVLGDLVEISEGTVNRPD